MNVTQLEAWLRLTQEEPLDPDLPICDPHHHLWDYPDSLPENQVRKSARLIRHYLLKQLLADIDSGHNIVKTVFIQCGSMYKNDGPEELRPIGETEFVQGITTHGATGRYGNIAAAAGIIGFADLLLGAAVERVLDAHVAAGKDRFRGVRFSTTWDANNGIGSNADTPDLLSHTRFREGFAKLQQYNLTFDAWVYFHQLPDLIALARAFPNTTVILDHIGTPLGIGPYSGKRAEVFQQWKKGIAELATCPNVTIKLGGLGMPLCGFGWQERTTPASSIELANVMAPYFLWCIEQFGVDRCMFESNFPVDKSACSYTVLWNAFKRITADFSRDEKAGLFHDTAVRIYRLSGKH